MKEITPEVVVGLWRHMMQNYRSTIHDKRDSEFMSIVGHSLDIMGILDKETFMSRFTTTVGDGIWIPFEIGVSDQYSLESQISICVHEHEHVIQFRRKDVQFILEYLSDSALRAAYEVEAMRCNMEIQWWHSKTIPHVDSLAWKLRYYNCADKDIETSAKALQMIANVVKQDAIVSNAGKLAIRYLDSVVV